MNPKYRLSPILPGQGNMGPLRDMAQEVISASAGLEGRVARETALAIGEKLRLINSYHSNLIEGHKTTIPDIERAMEKNFSRDPEQKYAQELCVAHVRAEKQLMKRVLGNETVNVCAPDFLRNIHSSFYEYLPEEHLFTHASGGFTDIPVGPGEFRDLDISVDGFSIHGPRHKDLPDLLAVFSQEYDPGKYHGDDRLIAMAASHHRLTWLHPFKDGNGRVSRLFSGLYLARIGINRGNLWSLARGFSRNKKAYMFNLWTADSPEEPENDDHCFSDDLLADFCEFFFETCLDQIGFMGRLLGLDQIESRIDWYVETRSRDAQKPLRKEAAKLLRSVFMRGALPRGKAAEVLNASTRTARRVVSELVEEGLLESESHRAPLTIGLPLHALPYYFPDLYEPSVVGEEYAGFRRPGPWI